jgi:transposase
MPLVLGVDPPNQSHTATALVAGSHQQLATLRVPASPAGYRQLLSWARQFPQRRWAVEHARGLGCHLTRWLLARGETVQDMPTTATARVRELSRGRGRKTDALDAAAAAAIAAGQGDAATVQPEHATMVLAVVEERRSNLVGQRTHSITQLQAVLRELIAGGPPRKLRADRAAELLRAVHPVTAAERGPKQVAWELVAEIRGLDRQLAAIGKRIQDRRGTRQPAARDRWRRPGDRRPAARPDRTGRPLPHRGARCRYVGAAPIEVASGERARHRLSRAGDRQLNHALHIIALVQAPSPGCAGYHYYRGKPAQPKTHR